MTSQDVSTSFELASADEAAALEKEWTSGKLRQLEERLLVFVERNREDILRRADGREADALLAATRTLIREARTVHLPSENQDQLSEIRNEIWYGGEKGNYDKPAIEDSWTRLYAPGWRRWRTLQYLFVADRIAPEIVRRLTL